MTALEIKSAVTTKQNEFWAKACLIYSTLPKTPPAISFDLRGTSAGTAVFSEFKTEYNLAYLHANFHEMIDDVIPHECAHLIERHVFKRGGHGPHWKSVMRVMGQRPERTHSFDISVAVKTFDYSCGCQTFKITQNRHTRILKGNKYFCRKCRMVLQLTLKDV